MKTRILFVALVTLVTISLRVYKLNSPVADWHSFRQVDTASVARLYVEHGVDLLHPKYHDLSNIQSGKDNPQGWRMVELPLYQAVGATLARTFPHISVEVWLRLVNIAAAAGTAVLLTLLVSSTVSPLAGVITGLTYAILPYGIFFGRTILPETFAVFWAILSLYLMRRGGLILSALAGAIALLVKPTAGFLLLPIPYLIFIRLPARHRYAQALAGGFVYSIICVLPLWWWRGWISQYPEGIPVFEWLLNKDNIRFKGAWFQWLFAERLGKLILGYWGLIPFGLGLLVPLEKKEGWLFRLLGLGGLLYLIVFAAGNVQHDYYQIILLPVVSIFVAKGMAFLCTEKEFPLAARYSLLAVSFLFMIAFSWYTMRTYYWINRPEIIEAGNVADAILARDAKVIAPYNGDTTFLYQTRRTGWPLGFDIDKKIAQGATHYVTVSPKDTDFETKELAEKYTVLVRNETFAIIDLTQPKRP